MTSIEDKFKDGQFYKELEFWGIPKPKQIEQPQDDDAGEEEEEREEQEEEQQEQEEEDSH